MSARPLAGALAAAALLLGGCGDEDEGDLVQRPPRGTPDVLVTVAVQGPLGPFMRGGAENFANETDVTFEVADVPEGEALEAVCAGDADVATTPVERDPAQACGEGGPRLHRVKLGIGAVALARGAEERAGCLTLEQLRRALTRRGGGPPLLGAPPGDPAYDLLVGEVLRGDDELAEYLAIEDRRVFVERLNGTERALGFFGFAEIDQAAPDRIGLVALDAGRGCVEPSVATIQSGRYPLIRPLHAYVPEPVLERREPVRRYLAYLLLNRAQLAKGVSEIVPISAEEAREALADLPPVEDVPAG